MDTWVWILIVAVLIAAIIIIGIAYLASRRRHSSALQSRFGSEYDQAVADYGDRSRAEKQLDARKERVERLDIRPLSDGQRTRLSSAWESAQARFVDDPRAAIHDADRLINEAMELRGYPVGDFEQHSADISVDHPEVVSNYREAHGIAVKNDTGAATTEELRQAMVNFRALFDDVVERGSGGSDGGGERRLEPGTR
ncbi:MAG: hypothetical protein M0R74_10730 [Dehalococcoidia bacterium]|nr:hypothetical protein [Dehalococcoidia bacterium]